MYIVNNNNLLVNLKLVFSSRIPYFQCLRSLQSFIELEAGRNEHMKFQTSPIK